MSNGSKVSMWLCWFMGQYIISAPPPATTTLLQDTADDAAQGPHSNGQANQEDGLAVDVRLHAERHQGLNQDVKSPHAEGQYSPHQVYWEQCRFLLRQRFVSASAPTGTIQDFLHSPGSLQPHTSRGSWWARAPARCGLVGWNRCLHWPSEPPPVCSARRL